MVAAIPAMINMPCNGDLKLIGTACKIAKKIPMSALQKTFLVITLAFVVLLGCARTGRTQAGTPAPAVTMDPNVFFFSKETGELKIYGWATDVLNPWDFPAGMPLHRTSRVHSTPYPDYGTGDLASVDIFLLRGRDYSIFERFYLSKHKLKIKNALIFREHSQNKPECVMRNIIVTNIDRKEGSISLVPALFSVKKPD